MTRITNNEASRELTMDEIDQVGGGNMLVAALIIGAFASAAYHLSGNHSDYNPACWIFD